MNPSLLKCAKCGRFITIHDTICSNCLSNHGMECFSRGYDENKKREWWLARRIVWAVLASFIVGMLLGVMWTTNSMKSQYVLTEKNNGEVK